MSTVSEYTKEQAEEVWDELRRSVLNVESGIIAIIENELWIPLGYPSFAVAWGDRMKGIRLATDALRAHVVYQMFKEGKTDVEVATTLVGVGGATIETLRREYNGGVPVHGAKGRNTPVQYIPKEKGPYQSGSMLLLFDPWEVVEFRRIAKEQGLFYRDVARDAVRERFAALTECAPELV